jgi:DNA polymerase I-like protein with 3'-5' exonuclease and polymerase domains
VVQALARLIVADQMIKISTLYPVVLTVHDAAVVVVPNDQIDKALADITEFMTIAPDWAKGLPVACEAKAGATYGDC